MTEFIVNMFAELLTAMAEAVTAIIHTAENWFGIWGAVLTMILISAIIKRNQ